MIDDLSLTQVIFLLGMFLKIFHSTFGHKLNVATVFAYLAHSSGPSRVSQKKCIHSFFCAVKDIQNISCRIHRAAQCTI